MGYALGINLKDYDKLNMSDSSTVKNENTIIALSGDNFELNLYYRGIKELITNNNRVILLFNEITDKIKKICMLMALYNKNDIYKVNSIMEVDNIYVEELLNRKPNNLEIGEYIGSDILAYSEINSILLDIIGSAEKRDKDTLLNIVNSNLKELQEFVGLIDYMRKIVETDRLKDIDKMKELEEELESEKASNFARAEELRRINSEKEDIKKIRQELDKEKENMLNKEEELKRLREEKEDINKLKQEVIAGNKIKEELEESKKNLNALKKRNNELEQNIGSMGNSGPIITSYATLNLKNVKCTPKSILYFKEISKTNYINSLIKNLIMIMDKLHKLRVKLVIYDYDYEYPIYKGCEIVNHQNYLMNKDSLINESETIVIVEPNQYWLESILEANYDIIIIYDRLKRKKDIVEGNLVRKFFVLNSKNEIEVLKSVLNTEVDMSRVITQTGIHDDAITISRLENYSQMAKKETANMIAYNNMINQGSAGGKTIDIILEKSFIKQIAGVRK